MRPLIGLNTWLTDMDNDLKAKAFCQLHFVDAITTAGGLPIIIPPYTDRTLLEQALAPLDGFCLIGGPDYHPDVYGGHDQPTEQLMPRRRHQFDLWVAEHILEKLRLPVLGVCGGHQLISIARGGALVQDLASEWKASDKLASTLLHSGDERTNTLQAGNVYRHEVTALPDSLIGRIVGSKRFLTNSFHHQAVQTDRIGKDLRATAWAPDGVIEAIESSEANRFILGVQWHPERMQDEPSQMAIFNALVQAAQTKHQARA